MKAASPKTGQQGFSTLEILLAMFILVMAFSATILVSFGNQSMISNGQTNTEALNLAQTALESAQAESRKDFNLVNPQTATTTSDGFTTSVDVKQIDYFTKFVTASVKYFEDGGRTNSTKLSTIVTNYNNAVGGDTCSSILTDAAGNPNADVWKTPRIISSFSNFSSLTGIADNYPVTDLDAYKGKLYVTVDNSSAATSTVPTFFDFDISNPSSIVPISNIDNDISVKSGLNAVVVAEDLASAANPKPVYAYVASDSSKKFQVIDVSSPTLSLVDTSAINITSGGFGDSIAYKNGYVYLGLTHSGPGPEFYIIDVHNPLSPALVAGGTFAVGNDINAIYVRDQYAYLATPNSNNLTVLNVSNPSSPQSVGSFAPAGGGNGKSLYLLGDDLYLGRTVSAGAELYILNNSDPTKLISNNPAPKNIDIGASVDGVMVRNGPDMTAAPISHSLAFLLTKTQFQVWDTSDLFPWTPGNNVSEFLNLPVSGNVIEPAFDCEKNTFFVSSNNSAGQGQISVIAP